MFPALVKAGRKEDIHVVWNEEDEIVGATVAALPADGKEGPMHESLAWPITLGKCDEKMSSGFADLRLIVWCHRMCRRSGVNERVRGRSGYGRVRYPESDRSRGGWMLHRLGRHGWLLREVRIQEMGEGVLRCLEVGSGLGAERAGH